MIINVSTGTCLPQKKSESTVASGRRRRRCSLQDLCHVACIMVIVLRY